MTMNKTDFINKISESNGFTKNKSAGSIEALLKIIKNTLASGEDILISGFGKFCIKQKESRRGRNPATGDDLLLPSRKAITFKCSERLRERLNK
jgi:integration host factor subunit alpha